MYHEKQVGSYLRVNWSKTWTVYSFLAVLLFPLQSSLPLYSSLVLVTAERLR